MVKKLRSVADQKKLLRSKRKSLLERRNSSIEGRTDTQDSIKKQDDEQEYIYVLEPVYSNYSSAPVSYNRVKVKKKKPVIVTIYER